MTGLPYGETVTVLTAGMATNRYSTTATPSWTDATASEVDVEGCAIEPRAIGAGAEPVMDARNAVTSGYTIYMPAGAAVNAKNRVRVRGEVLEVLGDPAVWRNPFTGWEPGLVIQAVRTEG